MVIHHPTIINKLLDDDESLLVCDSNYVHVSFISLTGNAPPPIDGVNGSLTRPPGDCHVGALKAAAVADAATISAVHRGPRAMSVASTPE